MKRRVVPAPCCAMTGTAKSNASVAIMKGRNSRASIFPQILTRPHDRPGRDARSCASHADLPCPILSDISQIPNLLVAIFRPWGFRGNEIRSQPTRLTAKTARCSAPLGRNLLLCVHQGVPLPSSAVASDLIPVTLVRAAPAVGRSTSAIYGTSVADRDLGHLKGRVAAVAHD